MGCELGGYEAACRFVGVYFLGAGEEAEGLRWGVGGADVHGGGTCGVG